MSEGKFRRTNQRAAILEYLEGNYGHPNVDEVYNYVKKKLPRVSKKTVYRNLQFLRDEGVINEVEVKGLRRYEPKLKPHIHLICKKCGRIKDAESDGLFSHAVRVGKKVRGFDVGFPSIMFYGICRKCKGGR